MKNNILIVDDIHPVFIEMAEAKGYKCDYQPKITAAEALEIIDGYGGLVIRSKFRVDRKVIDAAENLRLYAGLVQAWTILTRHTPPKRICN